MMHHALPALLIAAALAACATPQAPPLTLAAYPQGAPPDGACQQFMQQAVQRQAGGEFQMPGHEVRRVVGQTGEAVRAVPGIIEGRPGIAPEGSHPVTLAIPVFDNTFTRMYVDCTMRRAWFSKRGGVDDRTAWFGPFAL